MSFIRKYPVQAVCLLCMAVIVYFLLTPSAGEQMRNKEYKSLTAARNLCLACRKYSREHDGVFPRSLDALFPTYLPNRSALVSPLNPTDPVGYTYAFPGAGKTDSPDTIVFEDRFAPMLAHNRIVSYANGSARLLTLP
jgi:hypothetical protein